MKSSVPSGEELDVLRITAAAVILLIFNVHYELTPKSQLEPLRSRTYPGAESDT